MRFRYSTPSGDEVEVRDLDALREHVATGRVADTTPLFDQITGDFGPAADHKAYRFVVDMFGPFPGAAPPAGAATPVGDAPVDEVVEPAGDVPAEAAAEPAGVVPGRPEGPDEELPDLGVTLADSAEPESADEFVARLNRERASEEKGRGTVQDLQTLRVDPYNHTLRSWDTPSAHGDVVEDEAGAPDRSFGPVSGPVPGPASGPAPDPTSGRALDPDAHDPDAHDPEASVSGDRAADGEPLGAPPPTSRRALAAARRRELQGDRQDTAPLSLPVTRRTLRAAAALVAVAGAGYLVLQADWPTILEAAPDDAVVAEPAGPPPLDPRGVADRLAASQGIAFQHMVEGMDSLARVHRVSEVPSVWLEGAYLSDAAAHPEVEGYWERYETFVDDLRREDAALFRRSFMARMDALGIAPSVGSLRLAQAVRRFDESQPERDAMYAGMEELARSALALHDLVVARSADIRHTPVTHAAAVGDPFLQIYTEDGALQERIYELLDGVFENLEALHGETRWTRSRLNDGVLESLRATGEGTD